MLHYITRIQYCQAHHLAFADYDEDGRMAFARGTMPWRALPIQGLAKMEVSEESDSGIRACTTKLDATLPGMPPYLPGGDYAFLLTTADGTRLLLGRHLPPHPMLLTTSAHPARTSDTAAYTLTITLNSHPYFFL